jgi:hypothetical protein
MEAFFDDAMDDDDEWRVAGRKVPSAPIPALAKAAPSTTSTQRTLVASPYFSTAPASSSTAGTASGFSTSGGTLPGRDPLFLADEEEDENMPPSAAPHTSSDFDDDLLVDDSLLAQLDDVEAEFVASQGKPQTTQTTGSAAGRASSSTLISQGNVITIDSDEENGGKENVPLAERRVRRKVGEEREQRGRSIVKKEPIAGDDVIDISD